LGPSRANGVVFGASALGLGFLGPELGADCRIVYVDVPAKAALTGHLKLAGSYTFNATGLSMRPVTVSGVDGLSNEPGSVTADLLEALEDADVVFTAVGPAHLAELAPVFAAAAVKRPAARPLRVFCGENGIGIALGLRSAVERVAGGPLGARLRVGDTVMGRMCKVVPAGNPLPAPVAAGFDWAVVSEPFFGIPVEEHAAAGLPRLPRAIQPEPPDRFHALEDHKLLCHNGLHIVLACMSHLKGRTFLSELRDDAELMELGHRLEFEEAVPALLRKHGAALDRAATLNACSALLRRIVCPVFCDTVSRGVRDIMRKLEPSERLVYNLRTVAEQGIEPHAFATGLAAAIAVARRTGQTHLDPRDFLTAHCGLDPRKEADLIGLVLSKRVG
jgi:mannitol-1-phosphate 5-dehydrogenase